MKIDELNQDPQESLSLPFYISFSDLLVLLLVFFVMILATSKIETGAFEKLRSGFTGSTKGTLMELATDLSKAAKALPGIEVEMAEDGVRLNLQTAALFDTGSAVVKRQSLDRFRQLFLRIKSTKYVIDVEGHTDDRAFFKTTPTSEGVELETNWSLSGKRASSVIHHLLDLGFAPGRLRVVGYAATRPQKSTTKKYGSELDKARAQNRRVSILVH